MGSSEAVFHAITDSTRRAILDQLQRGRASVNELVECFDVTQPAISQHLRVLREAGLVRVEKQGRQRLYSLDADALHPVLGWISKYEQFWSERLTRLGEHLRKSRR